MRARIVLSLCALLVILATQRGSGTPRLVLVSPLLAANSSQFFECSVVNADSASHSVMIAFYDATGLFPITYGPIVVAPHGFTSISTPGVTGYHCEISADGFAGMYRGSVDVLEIVSGLPRLVVALPMQ